MKNWFYLLLVLYAATLLHNAMSLVYAIHPLVMARDMATVGLFGLCVLGSHCLAFQKRRFTPGVWRTVYLLTLAAGAFSVLLQTAGERFEVLWAGDAPEPVGVAMDFLNYILFAAPVIRLTGNMREAAMAPVPVHTPPCP